MTISFMAILGTHVQIMLKRASTLILIMNYYYII